MSARLEITSRWSVKSGHSKMPILTLETRSRIFSFQSHASRRDREFLPFSLMLRDEIENFFPSVSCFETRSRISSLRSHASRRDREFLSSLSCFETRPRRMLKKLHFCWGIASIIISPDNITLAFTFVKMSLFNRTLCEEGESESGFWRSGQNLAHSCTRWSTQIPDEQ